MTKRCGEIMNLREKMGKLTKALLGNACLYTSKNVDAAIEHLERVLSLECADSYFGQSYWHARVSQLNDTVGLTHSQQVRVRRLLTLLTSQSEVTVAERNASRHVSLARPYA
jgi:hypothetical protein